MSADVAEGDVVVVVGASGGIGRLVTQRYALWLPQACYRNTFYAQEAQRRFGRLRSWVTLTGALQQYCGKHEPPETQQLSIAAVLRGTLSSRLNQ